MAPVLERAVDEILEAATRGVRLTGEDALRLLAAPDVTAMGQAAHQVRMRKHPQPIATFLIDTNLNYTNACVSYCSFCAFYRPPGSPEVYFHRSDVLVRKVKQAQALGATQVIIQGGHHPEITLGYYEELFRALKQETGIHLHALSPSEVQHVAEREGKTVAEILTRLREAGMDSMPGGGAEILHDEVRKKVSPLKQKAGEWLSVMRDAHRIGMKTTATMMYGMVEEDRHIVAHWQAIRDLQDETRGFTAFIPWDFQPENTALRNAKLGSGLRYLKIVAISRLFLDNIDNIQASWLTQGVKLGQVALQFGANDIGSTLIEENVLHAAGVTNRTTSDDLVRAIRDAGFVPVQRNHWYQPLRTFS